MRAWEPLRGPVIFFLSLVFASACYNAGKIAVGDTSADADSDIGMDGDADADADADADGDADADADCQSFPVESCPGIEAGCRLALGQPINQDHKCYEWPQAAFCTYGYAPTDAIKENPVDAFFALDEAGNCWMLTYNESSVPPGWKVLQEEDVDLCARGYDWVRDGELVPCLEEHPCWEFAVDNCPVDDCMVVKANTLELDEKCFGGRTAAYCSELIDIDCYDFEPRFVESPDGDCWYFPDSCFYLPPDWRSVPPGDPSACAIGYEWIHAGVFGECQQFCDGLSEKACRDAEDTCFWFTAHPASMEEMCIEAAEQGLGCFALSDLLCWNHSGPDFLRFDDRCWVTYGSCGPGDLGPYAPELGGCNSDFLGDPLPICSNSELMPGFEKMLGWTGGCDDLSLFASNAADTVALKLFMLGKGLVSQAVGSGGTVQEKYLLPYVGGASVDVTLEVGSDLSFGWCTGLLEPVPTVQQRYHAMGGQVVVTVIPPAPWESTPVLVSVQFSNLQLAREGDGELVAIEFFEITGVPLTLHEAP